MYSISTVHTLNSFAISCHGEAWTEERNSAAFQRLVEGALDWTLAYLVESPAYPSGQLQAVAERKDSKRSSQLWMQLKKYKNINYNHGITVGIIFRTCCRIDERLCLLFHPLLIVELDVILVFSAGAMSFSYGRRVVGEESVAVVTIVLRHCWSGELLNLRLFSTNWYRLMV